MAMFNSYVSHNQRVTIQKMLYELEASRQVLVPSWKGENLGRNRRIYMIWLWISNMYCNIQYTYIYVLYIVFIYIYMLYIHIYNYLLLFITIIILFFFNCMVHMFNSPSLLRWGGLHSGRSQAQSTRRNGPAHQFGNVWHRGKTHSTDNWWMILVNNSINSEQPWFMVLSEDGGWKWMELTGELPWSQVF